MELPSVWQLQKIFSLAEELRLSEQEIRGVALQALGLSPLRRAWREEPAADALRLRRKHRDRAFGVHRLWPWRTKAEASKTIDALVAIRLRRMRAAP